MFRKLKLSEIGTIIAGGTPKTKIDEYWNGDISWITPKDLSSHKSMFIGKGERSITDEGLRSSSAKLLPKGAVLFTSRAPIGYVAISDRELATNQGFKSVVVNEENDNIFVYYLLKNNVSAIENLASGSTFKEISGNAMKNLEFDFPSLREQKAIARILKSLDEKIEANNQINDTLENMAQSIFKQWFVDFEFPNEDGEPYKSNGGQMVESELGMIPKGWVVDKTSKFFDVQKGLSYKGKHLVEDGIPMINLGSILPGGGYRSEKIKYYDGEFKDRHVVKEGDIVIANTDMTQDRIILGSPCLVPEFNSNSIIFTHHLFAIRNLKISRNYILYFLKTTSFRERAESHATGTTVLALPQKSIASILVAVANEELIKKFDVVSQPILEKITIVEKENLLLCKLRETLLPKLMSGEIRVPLDDN